MADNLKDEFYSMFSAGKVRESYDFLIANSGVLQGMTVREISGLYKEFDKWITIGEIRGLAQIIIDEASGRKDENRYLVLGG